MRAALYQPNPGLQRVDESRTAARNVESPRVLRADLVLHQAGGGGEHHVGRDGADDDDFQFVRPDAARRQALLRRFHAHVARAQALGKHVTLANASAGEDPLVGGVDHLFQVLIGEHLGRNICAEGRDLGATAHHGTNGESQSKSPCRHKLRADRSRATQI